MATLPLDRDRRRWATGRLIVDVGHPALRQLVDERGQVAAKPLAELVLNLALQEDADDANVVKAAAHVQALERVVLEDECEAGGFAERDGDDAAQSELG
jgi:hypothetical protein